MKKIVIAEKPSVAREIASILGADKVAENKSYYYNDEYAVTFAFGHLVTLSDPEAYSDSWKAWSLDVLPMIPKPFKLTPVFKAEKKDNKTIKVVDEGVKRQLASIKTLFSQANEIIIATDAGREGELIFRYIYEYLGIRKSLKRLWISSLTKEAIQKGFENLQDGNKFDNLYAAAFCRAKADWLVGMNATRALSVTADSFFSLGRVQTPTLCLIIQRFLENKNFVPVKYFQIRLNLQQNNVLFSALSENNYPTFEKSQAILSLFQGKTSIEVKEISAKEKRENPPLLFDLTTLQADCNRKFGFSAQQTLDIAQQLYEGKVLSYPRTSSRYISQDVFAEIPKLIQSVTLFPKSVEFFAENQSGGVPLSNGSVNDNKVTDHHALLPTTYSFDKSKFSEQHQKVYELIVSRMLEAFHEVCIKEITTANFEESEVSPNTEKFIAKGIVIKQEGWRSVLGGTPLSDLENQGTDEENSKLPMLNQGNLVRLEKAENLEKYTKPKAIHNEASLLKMMETAGKDIEDERLKEAMKEGGLGTPATRASTIETLIERDYIVREKKNLVPTEKGLVLYNLVKNKKIGKAELTGEWEYKLAKIEQGSLAEVDFMREIESYTNEILTEIESEKGSVALAVSTMQQSQDNSKPDCPFCKAKMTVYEKGIFCSNKETCKFVVWREQRFKKLTDNQLTDLITNGKLKPLKFTAKSGSEYEGILSINTADKTIKFDFPPKK